MHVREVLRRLGETTSGQWGLVTVAQADAVGVSRLWLSRLAAEGLVERVAQGVYRDTGAPADRFDGLRVAFIATNPVITAGERVRLPVPDAVVSGAVAAYLHGVGDLVPEPYEFTVPRRRKTRRDGIVLKSRQLTRADVTRREGLPVTTIERTIADLVGAWTDLSLVGGVVRDAAHVEAAQMAGLLAPFAARYGLRRGDGTGLWGELERLGGRDSQTMAEAIAAGPLGPLVAASLAHRDAMSVGGSIVTTGDGDSNADDYGREG
ncbi:MAG: type IV toxin-antitoxin system AbiEi family antitoxin domain-containing protein [Bifidobacteriaceae bacterium]|jgi:predicted transcriptional regulator of viral defense system|nr:type IV toxin-antitoxin system AbiEi family antitoxin domain-containing protein [Bifidobacteriaceae bacterium]